MKIKVAFIIIAVIVVLLSGMRYVGLRYGVSLQGLKPVFEAPPQDIAKLIAENTTGMPLTLPPGFSISIYARDLVGPRVMAFDPAGNMIVSITSEGKVVVLSSDMRRVGAADTVKTLLSGLRKPHGLALSCSGNICALYVAEEDKIAVYEYDPSRVSAVRKKIIMNLPAGEGHFTRTLGIGHDGRLYVSIGSSCDVCNERDDRRAKIFSMNPEGDDRKVFASGLRNAVFFQWDPADGAMWATEMGRDHLGDDMPPDEINIIREGQNYGWPVCYGKNIQDFDFDKNLYNRDPCADKAPSAINLPAHSAPLGIAFAPASWPSEYRNDIFVAYHGSWNRTTPTGYKIVRIVRDDKGNYMRTEDFISGWLTQDNSALGRLVDIVTASGAMYISDDKAGVIYKITHQ